MGSARRRRPAGPARARRRARPPGIGGCPPGCRCRTHGGGAPAAWVGAAPLTRPPPGGRPPAGAGGRVARRGWRIAGLARRRWEVAVLAILRPRPRLRRPALRLGRALLRRRL